MYIPYDEDFVETKELEICPICGSAMSDEEYEKNHGVCYSCGDNLKHKILYGGEIK